MQPSYSYSYILEYGIEKSQFKFNNFSRPPPLGELPKGKYMQ